MIAATIADRLREAAGANAVRSEAELERFTVAGVTPRAVVMPDSIEAAAATLAVCSEEGWPVEPAGAGSWLNAGQPPAEPPVVVSTAALTRIREYEPADLVAGAEAGVSLASLQQELSHNRQTLLLDPPGSPQSSLGAIAAMASAGPLRAAHGTPRDMVIGAEVITGDGRILHFGGRVVKNVAGYDIVRLLIGSRGSFGLLTSLFLRLRGTAESDVTFAIRLPSVADATAMVAEVRRRMEPDALELLGPGLDGGTAGGCTVLARFRGSQAAREEAVGRMREIGGSPCVPMSADEAAAMWARLAQAEAAARLCIRLADLPHRLAATIAAATGLISANTTSGADMQGWQWCAHGADGIVRLWPAAAPGRDAVGRLGAALPELASDFATRSGTVTWPVWPSTMAGAFPAPASPGAIELRLARQLKERFDPAGVLSPGRHLGGL